MWFCLAHGDTTSSGMRVPLIRASECLISTLDGVIDDNFTR